MDTGLSKFKKFSCCVIIVEIVLVIFFNLNIEQFKHSENKKQYRVDISRLANRMKNGESLKDIDLKEYKTIKAVKLFEPDVHGKYDYCVEQVGDKLYKFEYEYNEINGIIYYINIIFGVMFVATFILLLNIDKKVITPFISIRNLPVELAKGNLTIPIKEQKSKFFVDYLWGMDMLREKLNDDKTKELELIKEKKTLILSLSHDVKTPLSAIDLYTKALMNNIYETDEKKNEALEGIAKNSQEIKRYVDEITNASREDFLVLNAKNEEVYLNDILDMIKKYYVQKMKQSRTHFLIQNVENCLVYGDKDRIVEVLQNVIENALKYGNGKQIEISFDEEEECKLITVSNEGCDIEEDELIYLFDSFYRGSNSLNMPGSGLGLYICKQLMHKMDGDIFAGIDEGEFNITLVLRKM